MDFLTSESAITIVYLDAAYLCVFLNCFFPGVGSIINACMNEKDRSKGVRIGLLQILTFPIVIGWIWSIIYGFKILSLSKKHFKSE